MRREGGGEGSGMMEFIYGGFMLSLVALIVWLSALELYDTARAGVRVSESCTP